MQDTDSRIDNRIPDVAGTKPLKLRLGDWHCNPPTWAKAMEMTALALLDSARHRGKLLKGIRAINGIGTVSAAMRRPVKLESGLWIEINKSANECLRTITALLKAAGYPQEQAEVEYTPSKTSSAYEAKDIDGDRGGEAARSVVLSPKKQLSDFRLELADRGKSSGKAEKIGVFAKREIYAALAENRVPDEDFAKLLTIEGTKELLGVSLHGCPLFGFSKLVDKQGRNRCWCDDPATHDGRPVYVNSQWYEEYRSRLDRLLARWQNNSEGKTVTTSIETDLSILLQTGFSNGFRPGSIIDRNKFRRLYVRKFGTELPQDFDFDSALPPLGVVHDGKVFPVAGSSVQSPESFVKSLEERSHGIFFFDELFEKEAEFFTQAGVQSGEMLRTVLKKMSPEAYVYGRVSFTPSGCPSTMEEVLEAAFKTKGEWSREELESYLPYVPADKIVSVLAQDGRFVRVAEGTYRLLADILLDEDEGRQIAMMVADEVSRTGFFSMTADLFKRSLERNGDISPSAVQTAFFERLLSDRFDRHGKIVCAKGAPFDSKIAIRAFCRDNDEVTMEELLQLEQEFNLGGGNRSISTAHEEMVRVSEERFVAPRFVPFDVAAIDAALDSLVPPSGVIPLLSVRSFVSFPAISGLEWNVYLLEAFLRRASALFTFLSVSAAPRTACGAIVRRSAGFATVTDALARAVVEAGVSANETGVGDFLIAQSYIQRRRGVEKDVAEAARRLTRTETKGVVR